MKFLRILIALTGFVLIGLWLRAEDLPQRAPVTSGRATIDCEAIQPSDQPDVYYVHIITTEVSGVHVHRVEDKPFTGGKKGRKKALKECDRVLGQWENLYVPRRKKSR